MNYDQNCWHSQPAIHDICVARRKTMQNYASFLLTWAYRQIIRGAMRGGIM
jgi:hypothetical protein